MTWVTVITVILQLLGPLVVEWLRELLLESAAAQRAGPSKDFDKFRDQLAGVFSHARRQLWPWQFGRRAALRLVERAALRRSAYVRSVAARTPFVDLPRLTNSEYLELKDALRG